MENKISPNVDLIGFSATMISGSEFCERAMKSITSWVQTGFFHGAAAFECGHGAVELPVIAAFVDAGAAPAGAAYGSRIPGLGRAQDEGIECRLRNNSQRAPLARISHEKVAKGRSIWDN
jgi:hypothetical protein